MGNGNIWPSADAKPLNRSSPNLKHVIMSRTSTTKKLGVNPPRGFCPTYVKYTPKTFECLLHFLFLPSPYRRARWANFHAYYVIRRGSVQGSACWVWENLILIFYWFIQKKWKIYKTAPVGNFLKILNCHTSSCMQDRVVNFGSRVWFSGTVYLTASFKFTPGWPLLPWQRNLGQKWL